MLILSNLKSPGKRVEHEISPLGDLSSEDAIAGATKTITVETFIYWSGNGGHRFADALSKRAKVGVEWKLTTQPGLVIYRAATSAFLNLLISL